MKKKSLFLLVCTLLAGTINAQFFKRFRKKPVLYVEELVTFDVYLSHKIKYPEKAQENNLQGRTSVVFQVDENAKVSNIRVLTQFDQECTDSVIKALTEAPKFRTRNSRLVDTNISDTISVCFKLMGSNTPPVCAQPKDIIITGYGRTSEKK